MARPKKIHESRRMASYRLPDRLLDALQSLAEEMRRSYTVELEIAIEEHLEKHGRLPPKPAAPPAPKRKPKP